MDTFAIFGAGGFGREVMPLVASSIRGARLVFIDDHLAGTAVNGYEVISADDFALLDGDRFFNIAIANSKLRETIAEKMIAGGAQPFTVSASNALSLDGNDIGEGAIMCPFTMVTSNAKIGRFFLSFSLSLSASSR